MPACSSFCPPTSAGQTILAGSVENSFKQVDLEIVAAEEMLFDLIQYIAVRMDEIAADFALQMKMIPAFYLVYVLVTGALAVTQDVFADLPPGRQVFKVPVNGGLPDGVFGILKMAHYLVDRNMGASEGLHVIEDALSLPGVIFCRTFCHRPVSYHDKPIVSI
jgi:hypothetical protein